MIRIKIIGSAGQGIKFLSNLLANIFVKKGYEIALTNSYSSFIRSGNSNAKIIISKEKIGNPLAEEFDFEYDLTSDSLKHDLEENKINNERINITLLRKIISDLKMEISEDEIKECTPKKQF